MFTDSLYLYVCGLASLDSTPALEVVAKATGLKAAQNWVQKRQALVIKLLKALCQSATLTGPKVIFKRTKTWFMKYRFPFFILTFCSCAATDFAALPLCSGEPEPAAGSTCGECATHAGAQKLLPVTQWHRGAGVCGQLGRYQRCRFGLRRLFDGTGVSGHPVQVSVYSLPEVQTH